MNKIKSSISIQEQLPLESQDLTPQENDLLDYLKQLIKSSKDPLCPIVVQKTSSNAKTLNPRVSFSLNQDLSSPKWFSIIYSKNKIGKIVRAKIEIVLTETDIADNNEIANVLYLFENKAESSDSTYRIITFDPQNIYFYLQQLSPIIMFRFNFLYEHRLVEQCCCSEFTECSDKKQCVCNDRNMAMKCFYRKHLDHNEIFYGKNKNN